MSAYNFLKNRVGASPCTVDPTSSSTLEAAISHGNIAFLIAKVCSHRSIRACVLCVTDASPNLHFDCTFELDNGSEPIATEFFIQSQIRASQLGFTQLITGIGKLRFTSGSNGCWNSVVKYST